MSNETNGIVTNGTSPSTTGSKPDFSNLFDAGMEALLNGDPGSEAPKAEPEGEKNTEQPAEEPKETPAISESEGDENEEQKTEEGEKIEEGVLSEELETLSTSEKNYDIPLEAELSFLVDGKVEKLSIRDIKKQFSGKVSYERKFQDLAEHRKRFQADVRKVDTKLKNLLSLATSDPEGCLIELIRMRGDANPEAAVAAVMKAIDSSHSELASMTPEARELRIREKTIAAREREQKSREASEAESKERSKIESYVYDSLKESGISVDDFKAGWTEIEGMISRKEIDLSDRSQKELADITIGYIQSNQIYGRIEDAIRDIAPNKISDKGLIQEVKKRIDSDFTKEDIKDILREGYGLGTSSKNPKKESSPTPRAPQKKEDAKAEIAEEKLAWVDELLTSPF